MSTGPEAQRGRLLKAFMVDTVVGACLNFEASTPSRLVTISDLIAIHHQHQATLFPTSTFPPYTRLTTAFRPSQWRDIAPPTLQVRPPRPLPAQCFEANLCSSAPHGSRAHQMATYASPLIPDHADTRLRKNCPREEETARRQGMC